jgi:Protein of unknown function (DUF2950)
VNKTFAQRRTCDHYSHVSSTYPKFVDNHQAQHKLAKVSPGHDVLDIGVNDWQLPFSLMQVNRRWQFDSCAGAQEIVNRRIGRNEIAAIRVALTYVDAQRDYFERTKQNGGTGEYAQRLISTPDGHDGLYWPAAADEPESPFGQLVAQAVEEGYPGDIASERQIPNQGYYTSRQNDRLFPGEVPESA